MRLQMQVTASALNIRSGPSTGYRVVGSLSHGTITNFNSISGGWYKLEDGRGWCSGSYLKTIKNLEQTIAPAPSPIPKPTIIPKIVQPTIPKPPGAIPIPPKIVPPTPQPSNSAAYDEVKKALQSGTDVTKYDKVFSNNTAISVPATSNAEQLAVDETISAKNFLLGADGNGVKIYDYYMDYGFEADNLAKIRNNLNIVGDSGYNTISNNLFQKFNRFKIAYPDYHLSKTFSYVFFTRPDLNLIKDLGRGNYALHDQVANDPTYYYLFKNNPQLIISLTKAFSSSHDFHPFLSNTASSFELSDEFIKTSEHGETFTGFKVQYGKHNIESKTAGTFSVSYTDDTYFSVYKTHKAWIDYISKVYRGELTTKAEYIRKKILDYACSVYYIICGPDGETILFWSKYYGVFPTNAPSSTQSWGRGNMVKMPEYSINYAYAFKEDFSPLTLSEFNMNSNGSYVYRKTYDPYLVSTGKTLTGAPFIETSTDATGAYIFKLRFRA